MPSHGLNRRAFLQGTAAAATLASTRPAGAADATELKPIQAEIEKRHDQAVRLLQEWIHQPSIAAENRGMTEGCDLQMRLLRDAGFTSVTKVPTDGQPGVFATLDAGAPPTKERTWATVKSAERSPSLTLVPVFSSTRTSLITAATSSWGRN